MPATKRVTSLKQKPNKNKKKRVITTLPSSNGNNLYTVNRNACVYVIVYP